MTDAAQLNRSITRIALASEGHLGRIVLSAIAFFLFAILFPEGFVARACLVCGIALIALIFLLQFLAKRHKSVQSDLWQAAVKLHDNDAVPCFGTDDAGIILYRNPAARRNFSENVSDLSDTLGDLFATPQTVMRELLGKAAIHGAASQDIAATKGALRISVHRVEKAVFIWRLDQNVGQTLDTQRPELEMPMMRVKADNAIVDMNAAMKRFLGASPKILDNVMPRIPKQSGLVHQIETKNGAVTTQLTIIKESDDIQQIYFVPGPCLGAEIAHAAAMPVPVMRISPDGEILMTNRRARALLSLKESESSNFAEVVEGLGRPINEWLLDVVEGRAAGRTEVVRATRPAQEVYLQVALGRMVDQGVVSILAVLIDATELKTLEAQFVQSQKMQAIGQLAGGVAHDFNNLLTAISGHCDLLLLRHEPGDPNYGDLVQINQNANRAASLVGQLLAFSRKQNMQPEFIDLRDTLSELTHLLNRLVGEKIHLSWSHETDLPGIRADKRQLEQVLMNLVVNARDAMAEGGKITIETRSDRLRAPLTRDQAEVPPGDYVVVTVADEGCGIAPDKLHKIFEPFYSTKRLGEGTGLGLSMAYGIVKQSGGYIFADSRPNHGTTFTMYFPAHRGAAPVAVESPKIPQRHLGEPSGGVVLLVEDEAPVRAFASRALRLRGYTVLEAESAEQALNTLKDPSLEVDIFVTDVIMPGLDGPTWVTKALKMRPNVKVVFVSGYAEDSFGHNRAKIPNSVFLPKPFSLLQLIETVQNQLH